MNRLELAAQAPPMPNWYYVEYVGKITLSFKEYSGIDEEKMWSENNSIERRKYFDYIEQINQKMYPYIHRAEIEWRFYWADEMIKRNETNKI